MKKAIFILLCIFTISSLFSAGAVGNIQDTYIEIEAWNNSGGTPYRSPYREKRDYTSCYAFNDPSSGGSLHCWVNRSNSENNTSVNTVDRYYGEWTYNGASKNMRYLDKNQSAYLINYVKEDGYSYAGLGYIMDVEDVYYKIAWSPDSV